LIGTCPEKKEFETEEDDSEEDYNSVESDEIIVCEDCNKEYEDIEEFNTHFCTGLKCTKCGRKGHVKEDCYANKKS
jgi:hydrogenase maturation factor HypF (carbamoyltransferase family)